MKPLVVMPDLIRHPGKNKTGLSGLPSIRWAASRIMTICCHSRHRAGKRRAKCNGYSPLL